MVDPYEFDEMTPPASRAKQTRKKTARQPATKRKSNEKSVPPASVRTSASQMRTRSSTRRENVTTDPNEKENANQGFTQLIQTKMVEAKKRQGKRGKKQTQNVTEETQSPSVMRKRQRSDNDDQSAFVPTSTDMPPPQPPPPTTTTTSGDSHPTTTHTNKTTATDGKNSCHHRCDAKDHHVVTNSKRRRLEAILKQIDLERQLDQLEFAPDSASSQSQYQQRSQQDMQLAPTEEPQLDPNMPVINHSPPPLLLPSSDFVEPTTTLNSLLPPMQSMVLQHEETTDHVEKNDEEEEQQEESDEDNEKENRLGAPSTLPVPLSPTMPLNATYIARRSISAVTPLPTNLLALSSLMVSNTTIGNSRTDSSFQSPTCPPTSFHMQQNRSIIVAPVSLVHNCTNVNPAHTTITTTVQPTQCSVSTQTETNDFLTHHPCNDVSECPCVGIYTRSEQLFLASMAVFFRNSIQLVTPPELPVPTGTSSSSSIKIVRPTTTVTTNVSKSHQSSVTINQPNDPPLQQVTPIIQEIPPTTNTSDQIEEHPTDNAPMNETCVIEQSVNTVSTVQLDPSVDTSTVIHETQHDQTRKTDGSSIQIYLQTSREETNDLSVEQIPSNNSSNDQKKFQSLVLAMTALKDHQKNEFNRFIEHFPVRTSSTIDDTTTHLITDEDSDNSLIAPLTGKVLQSVARHLKVISYRWLTDCLTSEHYVEEIPKYEIIGDTIYNEHHGMSRSRLNSTNNFRLFANYAFHLKCQPCQPFTDNRPLIELIHLSGGLILKTLNQHINNIGRQIIILCSKTYLQNKPALQQACLKLNIICVEPEWLIASVVKFEVQSYDPWLCSFYS